VLAWLGDACEAEGAVSKRVLTLAAIAALFRVAGLPESRRKREGWTVCWTRDENLYPGQDLVRAWFVPGDDGPAALARYSRAITTMHAAAEAAGWRVDQLPAAIGGLLDVLLIGAPADATTEPEEANGT
jgi:hypothetical protein